MPIKLGIFSAVGAAGLMLWAGPALGATFYTETFESTAVGNAVPTGWSQTERNADDVGIINLSAPHNHVLQLRDYIPATTPDIDALAATATISTAGWKNVVLTFDWKGHNTEIGDKLNVDLRVAGGAWVNLIIHSLNSGWTTDTIALGSAAANTTIEIRFWTDVSDLALRCYSWGYCKYPQSDEAAKIDNVILTGDPYAPPGGGTEVPLPGAVLLMGTVLAGSCGLAGWRRRRTRAAG